MIYLYNNLYYKIYINGNFKKYKIIKGILSNIKMLKEFYIT